MFIQTEDTPNPATMKFLPSCTVAPTPVDFRNEEEAGISPLALALFAVNGVSGVYLGKDFISVTRSADVDWPILRPAILGTIMDHFASDRPVLTQVVPEEDLVQKAQGDETIVAQILELIETRIRPGLAQDGGDVAFEGYENGVVFLRLKGACAGCPSATATLKHGIESMLRYFIPEIQEVRRVQ